METLAEGAFLAPSTKLADEGRVVVCDCEVAHPVEPPYSFERSWQLGIAVFTTWSEQDGFRDWFAYEGEAILDYLRGFDIVTGYNIVRFDFRVLDGDMAFSRGIVDTLLPQYTQHCDVPNLTEQTLRGKTVDMMLDVVDALGHRLKLQAITEPTFGKRKTMDGADAPVAWQRRDRLAVISYCRDDVALERDLFLHGRKERRFRYLDKFRGVRETPIRWKVR